MRKRILAGLLSLVAMWTMLPGAAGATERPAPDLPGLAELVDEYITAEMDSEQVPGAAVTVIAGGERLVHKGYGLADVQRRVPVDPDRTRFLVGSQAKLFTAQAALQLVRAGKLDLDADVNTYLRSFQIEDTFPGRPVTLRHLLTHTAGFDEDHLIGMLSTPESLAAGLARQQPARVRAPGSGVVYNNYAVALAGHLVEIASGMPYADYVRRNVFAPLGMRDSSAGCGGLRGTVAYLGDGTPTDANCGSLAPGGFGPASTPADMGRYLQAQLAHAPRLGPGIGEEMQRQQHTEHPRLRGMGYVFEHIQHNGHTMLFKGGEMPGMNSYLVFVPELGLGLNLVANGDGKGGDGIDGIALAEKIVERYLPTRQPPVTQPLPGASADDFAGWYQAGRTSLHSMYKVRALLREPVHVTANEDGSIHTTGLSGKPKDWDQIEPGLFAERGGWGLIAFPEPGQLAIDGSTNVFDRIGVDELPAVHLGMLGFSLACSVLALLGFPLLATIRRAKRRGAHSRGARLARVLGWVTAAVITGFVAGCVLLLADESAALPTIAEGRWPIYVVLVLASLAVALACLMAMATVGVWRRGWWRLPGRLSYTVLTLGALVFAVVVIVYNFVGPPYT